ncbi:hypothetical protein Lbir_3151 [Legionella birminghamensis]|uniref:Uncharacterized protein n=1 Tax=Legionella birminghamensis TaxID=28083 RepID=A0A378ILH6_9GAMM|nr:hypothetical protein [Legionella birminghamensis]KTC66849.1 hypothetical protein Lbir_3151 [Legionella birminghamensis]STX32974.1 Uncharacterised protein [Legionella birminghamensis]
MSELETKAGQDSFTVSYNNAIEHAQYFQRTSDPATNPSGLLWGVGFMYLGMATSTPLITLLGLGLFVSWGYRLREELRQYNPSFFSFRPDTHNDEAAAPEMLSV